nr:hypothetical protein [Tanacetum cinerariifolium]
MASDDPILTTLRFIPQHEVVQKYDAILPNNLTNQSMKESKAYKTYYAFATGKEILKPKLSTTFKPKEPTFQVALDVLSLTPFYQAFLITASVPAIYMHEF